MNLQNNLTAFILFSVIYVGCNSTSDNQSGNDEIRHESVSAKVGIKPATDYAKQWRILENLLGAKSKTLSNFTGQNYINNEGRQVRLDSALQCISLFKPIMKSHRIMDTFSYSPLIMTRVTRKITEYEELGGPDLLEWMKNTVYKLDPNGKGKNLGIRLSLGIYTDEFLKTYHPKDSLLRAKKHDRITIFFVPHYYGLMKDSVINGREATAYEFGGLQP